LGLNISGKKKEFIGPQKARERTGNWVPARSTMEWKLRKPFTQRKAKGKDKSKGKNTFEQE